VTLPIPRQGNLPGRETVMFSFPSGDGRFSKPSKTFVVNVFPLFPPSTDVQPGPLIKPAQPPRFPGSYTLNRPPSSFFSLPFPPPLQTRLFPPHHLFSSLEVRGVG